MGALAKRPPRFRDKRLFTAVPDLLVLGVPEQITDSIRRIESSFECGTFGWRFC